VKDPLHVVFVIINFLYPFPPHFVGRIIFCSSILSFFNQKSLCNKLKSFSMLLVLFFKEALLISLDHFVNNLHLWIFTFCL